MWGAGEQLKYLGDVLSRNHLMLYTFHTWFSVRTAMIVLYGRPWASVELGGYSKVPRSVSGSIASSMVNLGTKTLANI